MAGIEMSYGLLLAGGQQLLNNCRLKQSLSAKLITALAIGLAVTQTSMPAYAGPPFRTDDPEPVDYQHWEFYGFSTATQVHGETAGIAFGAEVNYGAAPNLQLHLVAPLAFDKMDGIPTQVGFGDLELGAKYRFVDEDEQGWRPQIGIFPLIEVPTGDANRGLGGGYSREYIPIWVQKSFGDWTTYGGGGYWINPGIGNKNYWFVGWLVQRKVTEQLTLGGELFHQTADSLGAKESTGFNLGGFYDLTESHHLLFSLGRGIQSANDTNQWSCYLGYQYTI